MPHVRTHLYISHLFLKQMGYEQNDDFYLGALYPDRFLIGCDLETSLKLHFKISLDDEFCNLHEVKNDHDLNDLMSLGIYFHLWFDNYVIMFPLPEINKEEVKSFTNYYLTKNRIKINNREDFNEKQLMAFKIYQTLNLDELKNDLILDMNKANLFHEYLLQACNSFIQHINQ